MECEALNPRGVHWACRRRAPEEAAMSGPENAQAAEAVVEARRTPVNGEPPVAGRRTIAVDNPATGEVIGHVRDMDAAEVHALAERARKAQPEWEAMGFERRAEVMRGLR